ncbi:MAG: PIN domain-containing protein [Flavobacteriales bacterium]|jgi:predicted nucleic acid-binding protein|nr:PIN domain-containing protein [Flavobacteriales bacterium]MBK6755732.1 PIN domain-containing protein [Flavobacteriales bacterium]MBK7270399.1 PIN domain-containing protein [Flavobacteriales bacterium]MBK7751399.1 PIN domain-containing protein [Flavobacteriales bacterium]MBK9073739.1 PIN domain-containing protein [Flavobacteriales bacterium]
MRYFLDTNVLFDLFQTERPHHAASNALIKLAVKEEVEVLTTATSVMTMLYSLGKYDLRMDLVIARLNALLPHIAVARIGTSELIAGINSGWNDLEDAIQFHAAITAGGVDAIVSNDKDFKQQEMIPVITPAQAVKRLK